MLGQCTDYAPWLYHCSPYITSYPYPGTWYPLCTCAEAMHWPGTTPLLTGYVWRKVSGIGNWYVYYSNKVCNLGSAGRNVIFPSTGLMCLHGLRPGPDTHHCLASLVCRRSADDPTLTRHHDQTPNLIGHHCCGFGCAVERTHTPSLGYIFIGHLKSPEKQKTKINITVRLQTTTISQLQYHLQYNLHSRYKISIIHPSRIHP